VDLSKIYGSTCLAVLVLWAIHFYTSWGWCTSSDAPHGVLEQVDLDVCVGLEWRSHGVTRAIKATRAKPEVAWSASERSGARGDRYKVTKSL